MPKPSVREDVFMRLAESQAGPVPKLPLHLGMRASGANYRDWPEEAKAMLSQRERDAYEYEEQRSAERAARGGFDISGLMGRAPSNWGSQTPVGPPQEQIMQAQQQGADLFTQAAELRRRQLEQQRLEQGS